ncbi:MAG: hypothetical protein RIQ81_1248, partial [Pseudomonadota bacterium]
MTCATRAIFRRPGKPMIKIRSKTSAMLLLICFAACSNTTFDAGGNVFKGSNLSGRDVGAGQMRATLTFSAGARRVVVTGMLHKHPSESGKFALESGSVSHKTEGGFPEDIAAAIAKVEFSAVTQQGSSGGDPSMLSFEVIMPKIDLDGQSYDSQRIGFNPVKKDGKTGVWQKDEGILSQYGTFGVAGSDSDASGCKIESNGNQPQNQMYATVLTKPAKCDFRLPTVTIVSRLLGAAGASVKVPVGTFWLACPFSCPATLGKAHPFSVSNDPSQAKIIIDNGFMLVQPDGKTYLLADAGMALPSDANYKPAQTIANDLSRQLGFGPTELLQP